LKHVWLVLLAVGCKDQKPATQTPPPPATPAPAPDQVATPAPAKPAQLGPPISVDEARQALPKIDGSVIIDLKQTSDKRQVHGTWCIAGTGADDVAKSVGQAMAAAGYTALSIRGDARKSGVSGDRAGVRMSMIVGSSGAATCAAPTHYFASATLFHP
jgi:hypothetical protein